MNTPNHDTPETPVDLSIPLVKFLADAERKYLAAALSQTRGNKARAAEIAGLTAETMRKKMAGYTVRAVFELI